MTQSPSPAEPPLVAAARRLDATLRAENAALAALDLARAASLLPDKARAADAFIAAQKLTDFGAIAPTGRAEVAALSARLTELAAENRRLLDRALRVQSRVIRMIAEAVPATGAARYGARGTVTPSGLATPWTLSAQA
jgi:hypothetical protein